GWPAAIFGERLTGKNEGFFAPPARWLRAAMARTFRAAIVVAAAVLALAAVLHATLVSSPAWFAVVVVPALVAIVVPALVAARVRALRVATLRRRIFGRRKIAP